MATKTTLPKFEGRVNVDCIEENGQVSYLTKSVSLATEARRLGANDYALFEEGGKHVFFLFYDVTNPETGEVTPMESKYYLGKKLQNKGYSFIDTVLKKMVCFFSWNPNKSEWVPCVGLSEREDIRSQAHKLAF